MTDNLGDYATLSATLPELRHPTELAALPEIDDLAGPAFLYAEAVGATGKVPGVAAGHAPSAVVGASVVSASAVPDVDISRGDLRRVVERARELADDSRYDPALHALETMVDAVVPVFGSRDADVVEARMQLAELRFEDGAYAAAAETYRGLVEDLTAERGPYDEQVMFCQRKLASCDVRLGDVVAALTRLRLLHRQMAVRYGEQDRRVIELANLIRNIEAA